MTRRREFLGGAVAWARAQQDGRVRRVGWLSGLDENDPESKLRVSAFTQARGLKRAAIMFNPDTAPVSVYMPSLEAAARSFKVVPITAPVHSDAEIETAIVALGREPGGGLVSLAGAFMLAHRAPIILAAERNKVPAI
jgi:hypothetical protein